MADLDDVRAIYGIVISKPELYTTDHRMTSLRKVAGCTLYVSKYRNVAVAGIDTYIGEPVTATDSGIGGLSISPRELSRVMEKGLELATLLDSAGVTKELLGDDYPPELNIHILPPASESD